MLRRFTRASWSPFVHHQSPSRNRRCPLLAEPLEDRSLAAAGLLDPSFGTGGLLTTGVIRPTEAFAIAADDGILVGGSVVGVPGVTHLDGAVARFFPTGALDTSFGSGGVASYNISFNPSVHFSDTVTSLAVTSNGLIQAAGHSEWPSVSDQFHFSTADLDPTGQVGSKRHGTLGGRETFIRDIALDANQEVVALMSSPTVSGDALVQSDHIGLESAYVLQDTGMTRDIASGGDGGIVAAGTRFTNPSQLGVIKVHPADAGFVRDFFVVSSFGIGAGNDFAFDVLVQPDNKILVTGQYLQGSLSFMGVIRLNADGTRDESFGYGGRVLLFVNQDWDSVGRALALQDDGKILVYGSSESFSERLLTVARLNADGTVDTSFGDSGTQIGFFSAGGSLSTAFVGGGVKHITFGVAWNNPLSIGVLSNGDVVVSATVANQFGAGGPLALARLDGDAPRNHPPTIDAITTNGPVTLGDSVTVNIISTDPDEDPLTYEIDFDGDGAYDHSNTTGTFEHVYELPGAYTIGVRVTDDNAEAIGSTTLIVNSRPQADAGGPYEVRQENSIVLDGTGSADADGTIAEFEWDFDYDGVTFHVDAAGAMPTFATDLNTRPGLRTVALRVTDDLGASDVAETQIEVIKLVSIGVGQVSLNLGGNGALTVTIFSTADFDAQSVDVAGVLFAGAAAFQNSFVDVDLDGDLDLFLVFRRQDTTLLDQYLAQLVAADQNLDGQLDEGVSNHQLLEGLLTGHTLNGLRFEGLSTIDAFLTGRAFRDAVALLAEQGLI